MAARRGDGRSARPRARAGTLGSLFSATLRYVLGVGEDNPDFVALDHKSPT